MLKAFIERTSLSEDSSITSPKETVVKPTALAAFHPLPYLENEFAIDPCRQSAWLINSVILRQLPTLISHLLDSQKNDVCDLVRKYPELFNDMPTQTSVLKHDTGWGWGCAS